MYVSNASIINNGIERIVLRGILYFFGALALFYIFFLGNMVSNIIERRSLELNARTLSSEVRDLELVYLSLSNNIDLSLSYSIGFKETKASFATRKSLGLKFPSDDSTKMTQNDI